METSRNSYGSWSAARLRRVHRSRSCDRCARWQLKPVPFLNEKRHAERKTAGDPGRKGKSLLSQWLGLTNVSKPRLCKLSPSKTGGLIGCYTGGQGGAGSRRR